MNLKIEGWDCVGLRCPDVSVSLRNESDVSKIALVLMPNGTGKTTMLQLIKATLSGSARSWKQSQIREYQRYEDEKEKGFFTLKLRKGDQRLSIRLELDFVSGNASYQTTFSGTGGMRKGYQPPEDVERLLKENFVNLFVFDGEFAHGILNENETQANTVIETLCELDLLTQLAELAEDIWLKKSDTVPTNIKHSRGLTRKENELKELRELETELENELNERKSSLAKLQSELSNLIDKIDKKMSDDSRTRKQHVEAKSEFVEQNGTITNMSIALMETLRKPHEVHSYFADELLLLHESLDRLKLPENASSQFFTELIDDAEDCICGRPLDKRSKEAISKRASMYLDAEEVGTLNKIKRDIDQFVEPARNLASDSDSKVNLTVDLLTKAVAKRRLAKNRVSELERQLVNAGDAELKGWQEIRAQLELRIKGQRQIIKLIEEEGDEYENIQTTRSLPLVRRQRQKLQREIGVIKDLLELGDKKDLITKILARARSIAKEEIKSDLIQNCNSNLAEILENDPLRITDIGNAIQLENQNAASVGQTLSIGYTFLACVLNRGQIKLPLVVDSPAGPLSLDVRSKVGSLLPSFCDQFIAFIIDSEISGFVPALTQKHQDVKFLTVVRKTDKTMNLIPPIDGLSDQLIDITDNAILVSDPDYFFNFKIENEET